MKKVLVICDVRNWAFHRNYLNLKKYCQNYFLDPAYVDDAETWPKTDFGFYDIILNQCDSCPHILKKLDPKKHILAIRSNLYNSCYLFKDLRQKASIIAVANKRMYSLFYRYHPKIRVAPGGVDIDFFTFKQREMHNPPIVGWAGSNNDLELRGVRYIEEACRKLGFIYNPAYNQVKWRTMDEMLSYYHNDIDIYIDASKSAGRQNGLLEAGSCGLPVIATPAGISEDLIKNRENGVLIARNTQSIVDALLEVQKNYQKYTLSIRKEIETNWSWQQHALIFEKIFGEICG